MNPLLRKSFIIITSLFIISIILVYGVLFKGFTSKWTWEDVDSSDLSSLFRYSYYDMQKVFTAPNGVLITHESESSQYNSSPYSSLYRSREPKEYTLFFSDKQGLYYIAKGKGDIYNAVCLKEQCILFFYEGRRIINLTDFSIGELIPWDEQLQNDRKYPLALIGGKLFFSPKTSQLILVDNKEIAISEDEGESWSVVTKTEDLVKQYYAENFGQFTTFNYAVLGDSLLIWYNNDLKVNTLEVTLNLITKKVTNTRWLPLRVQEVAQNKQGDIYFISLHPSRELYSIIHYLPDGKLKTVYESGYKYLGEPMLSDSQLLVKRDRGDFTNIMILDLNTQKYTVKRIMDRYEGALFNPALSAFIRFNDALYNDYDDSKEAKPGDSLKYSYTVDK